MIYRSTDSKDNELDVHTADFEIRLIADSDHEHLAMRGIFARDRRRGSR